ncbi:MAG: hypothetical protein GXC76_06855 [Rhodanobacteraceae bacterium]|jgi:hypothetical protein|nr:hypothetical protein [Rhodanobacteraceae bacterium]
MRYSRPGFPRSRGAVLFIALIMLLLLTILGVTAMQVTLLQERMSGNFRAQQQAFERSEGRMAEGRSKVSDPLWAYDHIPDTPVALSNSNATPWDAWLTTFPPDQQFAQSVRACGGSCPERRGGIIGDDPNKKPRFYVISAQEKDPSSESANAAWATVQTIYVF